MDAVEIRTNDCSNIHLVGDRQMRPTRAEEYRQPDHRASPFGQRLATYAPAIKACIIHSIHVSGVSPDSPRDRR